MSRISKNNKIIRIHQLCSLEVDYKSQSRPQLRDVVHPTRIFGCPDTIARGVKVKAKAKNAKEYFPVNAKVNPVFQFRVIFAVK